MDWFQQPIVQTLLAGAFAAAGFIAGRRTTAADARARKADAETSRIIGNIEVTRDFYVQLLDWYARWQNLQSPGLTRVEGRPRFADRPQVNFAWLLDPLLAAEIDAYIAEAGDRARGGQRLDRGIVGRHLDLVDRTVRAAEKQIAALREGRANLPTDTDLSARLKAERVEELKREDPLR